MIPVLVLMACLDSFKIVIPVDTTVTKVYIQTTNKDNKISATLNFDL